MKMNWHTSLLEAKLIQKIASRAVLMAALAKVDYDFQTADMDVTACHTNGCALDLEKLLAADNANFGHDIFGIRRFIDRRTGQLMGNFLPRCALPQHTVA